MDGADDRGWSAADLIRVVCVVSVQSDWVGQRPSRACGSWQTRRGRAVRWRTEAPVLTVAARAAVVESHLGSGALACPGCGGRLVPWGHARVRLVRGLGGGERVRPRRSRCAGCRATHVLLPVFCLLRRAYSVTVIGAALAAKAALGLGHRRIAARLGVPSGSVRGWLRRFAGRAEAVRVFFTGLAVATGVDVSVPGPAGSVVADAVAAVGVLFTAARRRFAGSGLVGAVTGWEVASAASGGRLLSPGWPPTGVGLVGNTSSP
ncbi:MAG TPA: DUF6431 domain-containing protein [Nakamurella sp.]